MTGITSSFQAEFAAFPVVKPDGETCPVMTDLAPALRPRGLAEAGTERRKHDLADLDEIES